MTKDPVTPHAEDVVATRSFILRVYMELPQPRSLYRLHGQLLQMQDDKLLDFRVPAFRTLKDWSRKWGWKELVETFDREVHRALVAQYAKQVAEGRCEHVKKLETYGALAVDAALDQIPKMKGDELIYSAIAALKQAALMMGHATERVDHTGQINVREVTIRQERLERFKKVLELSAAPATPDPEPAPAAKANGHNGHGNGSANGNGHLAS